MGYISIREAIPKYTSIKGTKAVSYNHVALTHLNCITYNKSGNQWVKYSWIEPDTDATYGNMDLTYNNQYEVLSACVYLTDDVLNSNWFYEDDVSQGFTQQFRFNVYYLRKNKRNGTLDFADAIVSCKHFRKDSTSSRRVQLAEFYPMYPGSWTMSNFEATFNIPFKLTRNEAVNYVLYGEPEEKTVSHYIFSNTMVGDMLDGSDFQSLSGMNRCNFKIKEDAKIVGYVNKNYPYNITVMISSDGLVESNEQLDGGEWSEWSNTFTNNKWTYSSIQYSGSEDKYYVGKPFGVTFPIYASESQAQGYMEGTTSINDSLYDGQNGNWNAPTNNTGDIYEDTEFNTENPNSVKLSKTILCDANVMQDISRILYTETETFQDVLNGLDLYGEVPLSFIVDCFWLPFNPSPFCVTSRNQTFAFGKFYTQLNHEFDEVLSTNKVVQVANANFVGSFNDFRDYYTRYYLYLPYIGITELSAETYLYKMMTVKVYFDVRSGSIKYYILANGVVQDVFSGSVRMDMPIIGTDNYSASRNKLSIGGNAIADSFGGAMNTIGQINGGNPIGASTSALSTANSGLAIPTLELRKASPKQIIGGFSAEQSLMDSLDIVLYVESKEIEFDDNIRQMYQIADNRVGKLGSCNGFVLFDDLRLSTDASEDEKTLMMQQVSSGIVI